MDHWNSILHFPTPNYTQVLGLPRKADSAQINRVYKKKLAEARGNEAETSRIEAAHTSIMMSGLSSRLSVSKTRCNA